MKMKKLGIFTAFVIVITALIYMTVLAAQPGDAEDPLVTRRYVDSRIAVLEAQIDMLTHLLMDAILGGGLQPGTQLPVLPPVGGGFTPADRDALFADIIFHFELMYGEMLRTAVANVAPPQVVPFEVYFAPEGSTIIFEAGVEFILRSGEATVVAGPNGLANLTAGHDVQNGQTIYRNHLLLTPVTDGRGVHFTTGAWFMIRGNYHFV